MANETQINILGCGLCSVLGGFKDAFAASRAGINRFSSHASFTFSEAGDTEPTGLTIAPAATNLHLYQDNARLGPVNTN